MGFLSILCPPGGVRLWHRVNLSHCCFCRERMSAIGSLWPFVSRGREPEGRLIGPSSLSLLSVWVSGSEPEKSTTNWRRTGV